MQWFNQLKVGSKLVFGFSVMILTAAIIGFTGYASLTKIDHKLGAIFAVNMPSIDSLLQVDRDLHRALVAERSMIFANTDSDVFRNMVREYEESIEQSKGRWEKFKTLAITPAERAVIPKYEKAREEWKVISKRVVDGRKADTREGRREALDLTLGQAKEKFEEMRNSINELTGIILKTAQEERDAATGTYRTTLITLFVVSGAGLLVGLLLMWGISQGVTNPLRRVIEELAEASDQVASGSSQVTASSQSLAEGASEQAASIEETSSSLEEMSSMTRQNADHANEADNLMKEANRVVAQANGSMSELTMSMRDISKASEETSKIIKTIDEIAFQTNLLALNAAVEAARAGEAGAGFAVVADEVRNLAMRAADAAKNTAALIEGTVKKVHDGTELVSKTNEAFTNVSASAAKVGDLVSEIAAASDEQARGIDQVNKAVADMDKVTQQNSAGAEESASASSEMSVQAEHMKQIVNQLIGLVGRNNSGTGHDFVDKTAPARSHKKSDGLPRTAGSRRLLIHKKEAANPRNAVPMEDEDFRDF